MTATASTCPLCSSASEVLYPGLGDRHFGVPGRWDILLCRPCELTWLDPMPTAEELPGFYASYYTHGEGVSGAAPSGLRRLVKLCLPAVMLGHPLSMSTGERAAASLLSLVGPMRDLAAPLVMWLQGGQRGKLLDVGCGNGEFLARMRALGWEVQGIEPDAEAVRVACEVRGLEVCAGMLCGEAFGDAEFDAVTANHVLEHTLDPVATLRECYRVLKPGGVLVVTVPNVASLGRMVFQESWLHWDPPRHIWGFGPKALRQCVRRAGFEVGRTVTAANLARATCSASLVLRRDGVLPGLKIPPPGVRSVAFWLLEYGLSRIAPCGENLAVVGRKME